MKHFVSLALVASMLQSGSAFAPSSCCFSLGTKLYSSTDTQPEIIDVTLEKPLGMILEEVTEGEANGVFVKGLADEGSAADSKLEIVGRTVTKVMGEDVTKLVFDEVMARIIDAPSPVTLQLAFEEGRQAEGPIFELGTPVTITVLEDGGERNISAKVGDNLRKVLLDNNVEVYKGLKAKLGNCGGGGQCTLCSAEFLTSEGWEARSDYENQKLKNAPARRLTCLNNIQGPAKICLGG